MKKINFLIAVLMGALLLTACTKSELAPEDLKEVDDTTTGGEISTNSQQKTNNKVVDGGIDIDLDTFFPDREIRNIVKSMINKKAPNFILNNMSDQKVELEDFKGKPMIIEFAWSQCSACQMTQPFVAEYSQKNPHVQILQVFGQDSKEDVDEFVKLTNPSVEEFGGSNQEKMLYGDPTKPVFENYNIQFTPSFYFVDSEGVIRLLNVGSMTDKEIEMFADLAFSKDPEYLSKEEME